jgi:hypothetical protein
MRKAATSAKAFVTATLAKIHRLTHAIAIVTLTPLGASAADPAIDSAAAAYPSKPIGVWG